LFEYLGFPGFGSVPPPAHLLRFMMPPFLNPPGITAGKTLDTFQADLKKVEFCILFFFLKNNFAFF
jgi:hypothetical protein